MISLVIVTLLVGMRTIRDNRVIVLASLKVLSDSGGGDKIETQKLRAPIAFIHVCCLFFVKPSVTNIT